MNGNMYVLERLDSPMGKAYLKCVIGHSMQFTRNPNEAALFCEDAAMQMAMAACGGGRGRWLWPSPCQWQVRFVVNGEDR